MHTRTDPESTSTTVRPRTVAGTLLAALFIAACGGGSDGSAEAPVAVTPAPAPVAAPTPVAIEFAVRSGATDVKCGTPIGAIGTGGTAAELRDLRFYVSEASLLTDQDVAVPITLVKNDFQNDQVSLIDLEDGTGACAAAGTAATNTAIVGTIPAGHYTGVKFTVGVPQSLNHSDYAVADRPMDVQAMAWSWQAGRKYAQIELNPVGGVARPAPAAASSTFYVHLGATNCTGNPVTGETVDCARPNRMAYHSHAFNAATQRIVLDLASLLATVDLASDGGGMPGCMSGSTDPECGPIFAALKLDLTTGQPIDDGHGQQLFKVESK